MQLKLSLSFLGCDVSLRKGCTGVCMSVCILVCVCTSGYESYAHILVKASNVQRCATNLCMSHSHPVMDGEQSRGDDRKRAQSHETYIIFFFLGFFDSPLQDI